MNIEIQGTRTSDDAWIQADSISIAELRERTAQEVSWAPDDSGAAEHLARRLYAIDVTQQELVAKCTKLGRLALNWMKQSDIEGELVLIRLRCLRGLFDLHIKQDGEVQMLEIREELVDDLLQSGSREAAESLDRLFAANFGRLAVLKAS
jgi:hypothetical protein